MESQSTFHLHYQLDGQDQPYDGEVDVEKVQLEFRQRLIPLNGFVCQTYP